MPSGFGHRIAGRNLVADQHDALRLRQGLHARLGQHRVDARQFAGRRAAEQVIERQHRVGLAAAEIGLELHHRVAALAGQALDAADQQALEALGQKGAAEELGRFAVFVAAFAQMHLPEVGGELGLLIAAAGDVGVRRHHLAPRLQIARRRRLDQRAARLALLAAHLLVEDEAAQLHLHLADLVGLRRRDGGEQSTHRVERAVGVVAGERLLMRPACCAQSRSS